MRITVFGSAGSTGSRIVAEARRRGHDVTPVTRRPSPGAVVGDASDVEDVVRLSQGRDLVITATRPPVGSEHDLVTTTEALLKGAARTGVRLLVVGGAGSLITPEGTTVVDAPDFPAQWRPIALACNAQLDACRASDADWTYLSPPATLEPGERTGSFRLGADHLIVDDRGTSAISTEDLAVALLDEAENPGHRRERFTVGY